jgi:hypothetical protein
VYYIAGFDNDDVEEGGSSDRDLMSAMDQVHNSCLSLTLKPIIPPFFFMLICH